MIPLPRTILLLVSLSLGAAAQDALVSRLETSRFSPGHPIGLPASGRFVVAGYVEEGAVRVWSLPEGRELEQVDAHAPGMDGILALAVSPDERLVASASLDGTVRIWERESLRLVRELEPLRGPVWAIAFDPDGRHVASGGGIHWVGKPEAADFGVRIHEVESGRLVRRIPVDDSIGDLHFSPDGRRLAGMVSSNTTGRLGTYVWDANTGAELASIDDVRCLALGDDGLVSAGVGAIEVRDVAGIVRREIPRGRDERSAASSDARVVALAGAGELRLFDTRTGELLRTVADAAIQISNDIVLSPDGALVALSDPRGLHVWDVAKGVEVTADPCDASDVRRIAWSPSGDRLVLVGLRAFGIRVLLGAMGRHAEAALPTLRSLPSDRPEYAQPVLEALEAIGEPAVPTLVDLAADPNVGDRAIEALAALGPPGIEALGRIVRSGSSDDARRGAIRALGGCGAGAASQVPILVECVESGPHAIQDASLESLAELGPVAREAAPALRRLSGTVSPWLRGRIEETLARIDG